MRSLQVRCTHTFTHRSRDLTSTLSHVLTFTRSHVHTNFHTFTRSHVHTFTRSHVHTFTRTLEVKRFSPSRATIRSKRAYRSAAAFFEMAPVGCGPYKLDALTRSHNAHLNTRSDVHTYTSGTAHYNDVIMLIAGVTVTAGLPGLPHHWAADALITHCPIPTFTMRLPQFQCIAEVVHGAPCLSCPTRPL